MAFSAHPARRPYGRLRAAAYARYSTDHQTKNSIAYQLQEIRKYCQANEIEIVSTYTDERESGTNLDRQGFRTMLDAARRREFDAVVIYDVTRGSRDVGDWFSFRKMMLMLDIQVISATQTLGDITNSNDFLVELISVGMGQREVLETRQKSINGVAIRAQQGAFLGGTPPLGYDIVGGEYVINPLEAQTVRTIFSLYAAGRSYNDILDAVSGAVGKKGRPIGKNSLHSILTNERYIGVYTWNKRRVKLLRKWAGGTPNPNCVRIEGAIPPIIDNDTWERVQQRMSDNKRNASNKAKRTYLLSGLIVCEACGATYVGHTSTNKKGYETRYYVCGNKYRTRSCHAKNINADEIESFVVQNLKSYLLTTDFNETAQYIADQVNHASQDLRAEKSELVDIENKLNNGVKAILSGLDVPELRAEMDRLQLRKSELEDIIKRSETKHTPVDPAAIVKLFQGAVDTWSPETLPTIIRQHVTNIYAHTDGSFSVNVGVHIAGCGGEI